MLRYFIILFCSHLCFSYEYYTDLETEKDAENDQNKPMPNEIIKKTVPFDVASFLGNLQGHSADSYDSNDYASFSLTNFKRANGNTPSDDSRVMGKDKRTDLSIINFLNVKNPTLKDNKIDSNAFDKLMNRDRFLNHQSKPQALHGRDPVQDPEKKCLFKKMKIPFFSHKSATTKKQKDFLFCLNCLKPYADNAKINATIKFISEKIKKTYGNVCPTCIQNLITKWNKKKKKKDQIHNSRDFYKQFGTSYKLKPSHHESVLNDYYFFNYRIKRADEDQQRQLHELAEVERKVNLVTTPNFHNLVKIPT